MMVRLIEEFDYENKRHKLYILKYALVKDKNEIKKMPKTKFYDFLIQSARDNHRIQHK